MTNSMDRQAILLLAVYVTFGFANALSGTFIPVYLWKATESYLTVALFSLAQYGASGITFYLCGKWVKQGNKLNCLRVGCLLSGVFYCIVLWLQASAAEWVIWIGIISGIGLGCYWVAYNVLYFEITEPDTRDRFNGSQGLLGAATGILAPWLSGMLISMLNHDRGYNFIFTASLILFIGCIIFSFFLVRRKPEGIFHWQYPLSIYLKKDSYYKQWRRALWAVTAQGVREGVFFFLINLVVFIATKNEAKVGTYTLIVSLTSLVSFWLIGKILKPEYRSKFMLVGVLMLSIAIIPFFWSISYRTLIIFGITTALLFPLYIIPITSKVYDMIGASKQSVEHREELIIVRELALTFGRVIGLIPFFIYIMWMNDEMGLIWVLMIVGSAPIAGWLLLRPLFKLQHKRYFENQMKQALSVHKFK